MASRHQLTQYLPALRWSPPAGRAPRIPLTRNRACQQVHRPADRLTVLAIKDRHVGTGSPTDDVANLVGVRARAPAGDGSGEGAELLSLEKIVHRDRQRQDGGEFLRRLVGRQGGRDHLAIQFQRIFMPDISGGARRRLRPWETRPTSRRGQQVRGAVEGARYQGCARVNSARSSTDTDGFALKAVFV